MKGGERIRVAAPQREREIVIHNARVYIYIGIPPNGDVAICAPGQPCEACL